CGGDGTIHDVLQGMVSGSASLGIITCGTANSLAHDLRIPHDAASAARAALAARPRRIALGKRRYLDFAGNQRSRYFIVAAGVGVDAHLFYKLNLMLTGRLGMTAYYAKAAHLWLTHRMDRFLAESLATGENEPRRAIVCQFVAVATRNSSGGWQVV